MLDDVTALIFDIQCCIRFYALTMHLPVATFCFLDVKNEDYTHQKVYQSLGLSLYFGTAGATRAGNPPPDPFHSKKRTTVLFSVNTRNPLKTIQPY